MERGLPAVRNPQAPPPQERSTRHQAPTRFCHDPDAGQPGAVSHAFARSGLAAAGWARIHLVRMKRTNLVLDGDLLEEATRLSGERTYSRTVERALRDFVKRARARRILELAGSGLWEGDLSVVREDRGVYRTRRRGPR